MVSLFKLEILTIILTFSSSFVLHRVLLVARSNTSHTPHRILDGVAIWRVRWWDVTRIVVREIFWQLVLGSPVCEAWCRVLLSDLGSSCCHPLNPSLIYCFPVLDAGFRIESEAIWEYDWWQDVTITSDLSKHHDVNWVSCFHRCLQIDTSTRNFFYWGFCRECQQYSILLLNFCRVE